MRIETIAIQAGRDIDRQTGAVMPPIHLSTTFVRGNEGEFVYSRSDSPNRRALEQCLTQLEGGAAAVAFGSGMAAMASVFQALRHGDHVILPDDTYFGVRALVTGLLADWGLAHTMVDMTDLAAVKAAMQPNTKMVWVETPSNPMLKVTDIAAVADIAHNGGARLGVDATWATPLLQHSLALGADIAAHSTTKYLGGHSDLTGGVVVVKEEDDFYERIRRVQEIGGAVPSGFDCWLLLRGIRTLPLRMRQHNANALALATFLESHPAVEWVRYPGLASHPQHEVALAQLTAGFGGMLSFKVHGGAEEMYRFCNGVELCGIGVSLGDVCTLVYPKPKNGNLIRVSVGCEDVEDIVEDFTLALAGI